MKKALVFLLCFALAGIIGLSFVSAQEIAEERISETNYRKVVILGEGSDADTAVRYANSYRAVTWFKVGPRLKESLQPGYAMKELITELEKINATGEKWDFIVPEIGERYLLLTLNNMKDGSMSKATGTIYLPDSSENEPLKEEIQRVSGGSFVMIYGR